jgi:hypothetical protein
LSQLVSELSSSCFICFCLIVKTDHCNGCQMKNWILIWLACKSCMKSYGELYKDSYMCRWPLRGRLHMSDSTNQSPDDSVHNLHIKGWVFWHWLQPLINTISEIIGLILNCIPLCAWNRTRNCTAIRSQNHMCSPTLKGCYSGDLCCEWFLLLPTRIVINYCLITKSINKRELWISKSAFVLIVLINEIRKKHFFFKWFCVCFKDKT